jgi:5-methylcytosine-specific restriction endonuclease McrA
MAASSRSSAGNWLHGRKQARPRRVEGIVGLKDTPLGRRDRVLHRDRLHCVYCGGVFAAHELTLDHVEPRMRGGDDSEGNLVACCEACNRLKGGQAAWSYLAQRPEQRENFLAAVEASDTRHAKPVWSRLLRAIREAAEAEATRRRS